MSEVLQANIFFFITGIAVIVFTLLLCIALYHVVKILKSVRQVIERIEKSSEIIAEDVSNMREYFKGGGFFSHVISMFMKRSPFGATGKKKKASKKSRSKSSRTELSIKDED